jgi:putative transposase
MPSPRRLYRRERRSSHYHCVSRVVDRNFVFGAHERDVFRKILRQVESFSGVRVLTWTILSNHFHVLLEVPPQPEFAPGDAEILDRCRALYSKEGMIAIECEFSEARRSGDIALERVREKYLCRMWDLSEFMKTLKQKFSRWFNRKHDRVGTLWESRFKSVIVEGSWNCLLKVAAYIDLNGVRGGIVGNPVDYHWCGYAEAVAGDRAARKGLAATLADVKEGANWRDVGSRYRKILFGIGEETSVRAGISREEVASVWAAGGKLSLAQLLRCRVRYFTEGLAVGTASFIEEFFSANRALFGSRRKSCSRRMRGGDWGGLRSARALRVEPISVSPQPGGAEHANPPPSVN